jgi:tetratricopeptide (TPR) repeat protein
MAAPGSPAALVRQARSRIREGDPEEAMALCDRASALDPTYTLAIEVRDLACYMPVTEHERLTNEAIERNREGRYEEGRALSKQALAIKPDFERAKKALEDATIERSSSKYSVEARDNTGIVINEIIVGAQAALFKAVADNEGIPESDLRKLIDGWKAAGGKVAPRVTARRAEAKPRAKKAAACCIRKSPAKGSPCVPCGNAREGEKAATEQQQGRG